MKTKYYTITNAGEANCEIVKKLSEKEANLLNELFKELNGNSNDSYAPAIFIDLSTEADLERHGLLEKKTDGFTSYWDYIDSLDSTSDKWRIAMNLGTKYHKAGKNPDDYIEELIKMVEEKK